MSDRSNPTSWHQPNHWGGRSQETVSVYTSNKCRIALVYSREPRSSLLDTRAWLWGPGYKGLGRSEWVQGPGYEGLGMRGPGYDSLGMRGPGYDSLGMRGPGYEGLGMGTRAWAWGSGYKGLGMRALVGGPENVGLGMGVWVWARVWVGGPG